jgi:uncharacterized DUF497 family protein
MKIKFEWDENKNAINKKKHKISFEEARTVFYDENAILFFDEEHTDAEERYIMLGYREKLKMLVVCDCYIQSRETIRIYSARKATKNERKYYNER